MMANFSMRMFSKDSNDDGRDLYDAEFRDPQLAAMRSALKKKAEAAGIDFENFA